ncbi:microfibril-associated glycoprotein 4 [Phocoena phocoena]|uniref:microfibril-associated glycoprotein 4 n=1 Tax=Phocoena phocoena TaxID=9742 RepID=UPI003307AAB8
MRDVCDELPGACVCGSVGSQYTAGAPKTPDLSGRRLHAGVETQPLPSSAQGQVRRWAAARETEPQSRLRRGLHATKPGEAELYFVSHKQSGCKALEVGLSHTSHSSPIQGLMRPRWSLGWGPLPGATDSALLAPPLLLLLCTGPCVPQLLGIRGDALERSCLQQPLDCDDIYAQGYQADGVYLIYPSGPSVPVPVFCDMTTEGGKWTVFQKRFNGSVSFFRGWNDYKLGFGRADGEYWLGLQNLHLLTLKQKYELRVDLEDFENNTAFAKYNDFSISPNAVSAEEDGYSLHVSGFEDGGAGDSLSYHSGQKFSTFDRDQDLFVQNCAALSSGAFWFRSCHFANLNGFYLGGSHLSYANGINWAQWKGFYYSLKRTEMKIRRA